MRTFILEKNEVSDFMTMEKCIDMCDKASALTSEGKIINFSRSWLKSDYGGLLGTAMVLEPGYLALKLLTRGLQIILLVDYTKGILVLMDGSIITDLRTGAAGAVSVKYLAKNNSENVGIIGSGNVAKNALWALCETISVKGVNVYSRTRDNRDKYAKEMGEKLGVEITAVSSPAKAVENADIIITATKADQPVLLYEYVSKGAHISALGNQPEVDPKLFLRTKVFTELLEQSKREGKLSYAIKAGVVDENVIFPELGDVILGIHPGRTSSEDITLYDSQGLTAHDAVPAWEVYSQLSESGKGKWLDLDFGGGIAELLR